MDLPAAKISFRVILFMLKRSAPRLKEVCLGFSDYNHCDTQDDGLGPIAKLEKYAASENIFNR